MAVGVFVLLRFSRADPDGSACERCGSTPWLEAWVVMAGPRRVAYLCPDCREDVTGESGP